MSVFIQGAEPDRALDESPSKCVIQRAARIGDAVLSNEGLKPLSQHGDRNNHQNEAKQNKRSKRHEQTPSSPIHHISPRELYI
jgi:hypothetical protein